MLDIGILVGLVGASLAIRTANPAWLFMWAVAFAVYFSCKWMTWRRVRMPWFGSIGYLFLWPGMDPGPFVSPALTGDADAGRWMRGTRNAAMGAALLVSAVYLSNQDQSLWAGWLGMMGIVLFLHFGVFDLLAVAWNRVGIRAKPVMQGPILATSVAEFWGRRWNTAFNDLAYGWVFRRLIRFFRQASARRSEEIRRVASLKTVRRSGRVRNIGRCAGWKPCDTAGWKPALRKADLPLPRRGVVTSATLLVFTISGLVHELVISVPARGGYGLPTGYFILQGLAVLFEKSHFGQRVGLGHGVRGWLFTVVCTAGPAFWLFHPTFVRNVILPMLRAFGGN